MPERCERTDTASKSHSGVGFLKSVRKPVRRRYRFEHSNVKLRWYHVKRPLPGRFFYVKEEKYVELLCQED